MPTTRGRRCRLEAAVGGVEIDDVVGDGRYRLSGATQMTIIPPSIEDQSRYR
jgi:hypothetical protein